MITRALKNFNWQGALLGAVLLLAWQLAAKSARSPSFPDIVAVLHAFVANGHTLAMQMAITLGRAAAGFALALGVMLPLGIFVGRTPRIGRYVEPVVELLRPLPPLAIVPVAMLFAGTGSAAKISVIFYSAAFPILLPRL